MEVCFSIFFLNHLLWRLILLFVTRSYQIDTCFWLAHL